MFFLYEMKKGNVNDIKYRKLLVNVLVNSIYLYDDNMTITFNIKDGQAKIDIALLEDLEGSFADSSGSPK